jgi:hypothetical protein
MLGFQDPAQPSPTLGDARAIPLDVVAGRAVNAGNIHYVRNPTLLSTLVRTISRTGNQPASRRTPTVMDRAWETGRPAATFKIKTQNILEVVMSSRKEHARAQAQVRLQQETPITDDASLLPLQEEAAAIVREAKRRDPSGIDELVSTVLDEVARSYFRHALRHR